MLNLVIGSPKGIVDTWNYQPLFVAFLAKESNGRTKWSKLKYFDVNVFSSRTLSFNSGIRLLMSWYMVITWINSFNSLDRPLNHKASIIASLMAIYYASMVNKVTTFYKLTFQLIAIIYAINS